MPSLSMQSQAELSENNIGEIGANSDYISIRDSHRETPENILLHTFVTDSESPIGATYLTDRTRLELFSSQSVADKDTDDNSPESSKTTQNKAKSATRKKSSKKGPKRKKS